MVKKGLAKTVFHQHKILL